MASETRQLFVDRFYAKHGPCCAGCDHWHHVTSMAGECTRAAPVASGDRFAILGMYGSSLDPGAGHIMTPRDHCCGEFADTFDWTSLPPHYLRSIGRGSG